jgi:RNA polymerase subunit RPABC4/transcription elongation factor Spt4
MVEHPAADAGVCPKCQKRTLLRAVIQEVEAALAPSSDRHEHVEFEICPVCGWNNLPERWEQR